jgi:hypothetical protein
MTGPAVRESDAGGENFAERRHPNRPRWKPVKVVCAWCRREGRTGFLGYREPLADPSETHGICPEHYERMLATLPAPSSPGLEALIVVNRRDEGLLHYLEESFGTVRGVQVIMERRNNDRRQDRGQIAIERRHMQRRVRRGRVFAMGYRMIRFSRAY